MQVQRRVVAFAFAVLIPATVCLQTADGGGSGLRGMFRSRSRGAAKGPAFSQVENLVIARTNTLRKSKGRAPLKEDAALSRAARDFARYMARTERYGHEADGRSPAERARKQGYDDSFIAENIAWQDSGAGFDTKELAEAFFEMWDKSRGHRRNMLHRDMTETGVGLARSRTTGRYYAVQMFGRPASRTVEFRVTNGTGSEVWYQVGEGTYTLAPGHAHLHRGGGSSELMLLPGGPKKKSRKGKSVQPRHGEHYTIEEGLFGRLKLEEQ